MSYEEITKELPTLSNEEKLSLTSILLHSIEQSDYDVSDEEVAKRVKEGNEDDSVFISYKELKANLSL